MHFFSDKYDTLIQRSVKRWWPDFPDWKFWKAQLYQESLLNPDARSSVGAEGIAQFMPATWAEVSRQIGAAGVSAREARYAIDGGAYYMASLRRVWTHGRTVYERHNLAEASYNTGTGNVLHAQRLCGGAILWKDIMPCLPKVTGRDAKQTTDYVKRIAKWREMMGD